MIPELPFLLEEGTAWLVAALVSGSIVGLLSALIVVRR